MKFLLARISPFHLTSKVLLILAVLFAALQGHGQDSDCYPPKPEGYVVDAAEILSSSEEAALNSRLNEFDQQTSNQIVVVTLETLCEGDAAMTAYTIGENWKVGQDEFDNGLVILIKPTGGPGERHTFIATGYGLEGAIPDATTKLIVDREMIPAFKNNNYFGGINAGLDVITELARGEYSHQDYRKKGQSGSILGIIFPLLFVGVIWFLLMYRKTNRYARDNDLGFWAALLLMSAANRSHRGSYNSFSSGSGIFGGGGGSGGFGGFGGGSFGGGGAGGSW